MNLTPLTPLSEAGMVSVGRVTAVNQDGADLMVSLRITPNTEDGRVVMTPEKALEVAAKLMVHAAGGGRE